MKKTSIQTTHDVVKELNKIKVDLDLKNQNEVIKLLLLKYKGL